LLAARLRLPIAHVEAGCRSDDAGMAEEQNRIIADHLSRLLLAPSPKAMENLRREGIGTENDARCRRAVLVGDIMYDALLQNVEFAERSAEENLLQLGLQKNEYYLLTLHRAENTDRTDRLRVILQALETLDLPILFPVHPRTKHALELARIPLADNFRPVEPLGYLKMLTAEKYARKILTDSGGVQKEAFYLRVPCVTLRDATEWPETVELGANRIVGTSLESIREAVGANHQSEWTTATPYGDGKAAEGIVKELYAQAVSSISLNPASAEPPPHDLMPPKTAKAG
jgi:UDP-GlcNAc3NAcA epimerase